MTATERDLAKRLRDVSGAYAIKYKSPNGRIYYRVKTDDQRPIKNIPVYLFRGMEIKGYTVKTETNYHIDIPKLTKDLDIYNERKSKKHERQK